ncbi:glycoside hydrolase family 3 protein [Gonapodya prolifera JEL478]|uniref:beta-glucosidase n=1 Tax=Gonapodya prolifera (strain JEL478) TaxID=1344416 RepID=A0A139A8S9_GONPJ|nr:glycoside hydrolase family 3 protein [Gonapodya prolifera JEL478]|eukprot:KXS13088.1 glycoside hydrolase family 3 protein [Gonapodya prolifera JEL478]
MFRNSISHVILVFLIAAGICTDASTQTLYERKNVIIDLGVLDKRPIQLVDPFIDWDSAWTKAQSLLSNLTLEDKVDVVTGIGWAVGPCIGNIKAKPDIGFQGLCLQDSPTGVRFADLVSAFPAAINVGATFDKLLMFRQGLLMGREERGKGVQVTLGPCVNIMRAPEGGRAWEAYGPDPVLASFAAQLTIQGIQSQGVIATVKHFVLNEQEHKRTAQSSQVGQRALYEVYLRPFKASVDAGVGAVMCSYNLVNGTYACENPALYKILKDELGFRGFVMTDWWAAHSGAPTANAGVDMMMPGSATIATTESFWGPNLVSDVKNGAVPETRLDDMVTRILATWIKFSQDDGFPEVNFHSFSPSLGKHVDVQAHHKVYIREVGAASAVLVKNNRTLPLSLSNATYKTIAVIGEDAFGPSNGLNSCADHGCVDGTVAQGWGSGTTYFPYIVAPVDGIKAKADPHNLSVVSTSSASLAPSIATMADIAIVFVFANSGEEYITVDRNDLHLWHDGDALVKSVADVQKTIVVIHSPGPVLVPWIHHPNITAVVFAGMPGQETGNAIADVMFGDVNPSGRLPYTVAASPNDYPAHVERDASEAHYTEGILVDYRWFEARNITPVFPYGHGLSYTTFAYSNLTVKPPSAERKSYRVSVNVTNTGTRAGHEVVQLYLALPMWTCQAEGCAKELRDFNRVHVRPNQTVTVTMHLYKDDLAMWDVGRGRWVVAQGVYEVFVGASSADVRARGKFAL